MRLRRLQPADVWSKTASACIYILPQVQVAPHLRLYLQESKQQDLQTGLKFSFTCVHCPYAMYGFNQ